MALNLHWGDCPASDQIQQINELQKGDWTTTTFVMGTVLMVTDQTVMGAEAFARTCIADVMEDGEVIPFRNMKPETFALLCKAYEGMRANVSTESRTKWGKRFGVTAKNPLFAKFLAIYENTSAEDAVAFMDAQIKMMEEEGE